MYPTSVIYRIAMYAHHVCGMKTFTSADLNNLVRPAHAWYDSRIPQSTLDEAARIITKHGFTEEQWVDVLQSSRSFYFMPTDEVTACNNELRELMEPVTFINSPPGHAGYVTQLIRQAVTRKSPVLEYVDRTKPPFTYRINPILLEDPTFAELRRDLK